MHETSFELAQELYELSGWPGVVEWFAGRSITDDNYPGYTLGYLLRKVRELTSGATNADIFGAVAEFMENARLDFEDAAAMYCIQLFKQGMLSKAG